jgi:hypothetical protein
MLARESNQPAAIASSVLTKWMRRVGHWVLLLKSLAARWESVAPIGPHWKGREIEASMANLRNTSSTHFHNVRARGTAVVGFDRGR